MFLILHPYMVSPYTISYTLFLTRLSHVLFLHSICSLLICSLILFPMHPPIQYQHSPCIMFPALLLLHVMIMLPYIIQCPSHYSTLFPYMFPHVPCPIHCSPLAMFPVLLHYIESLIFIFLASCYPYIMPPYFVILYLNTFLVKRPCVLCTMSHFFSLSAIFTASCISFYSLCTMSFKFGFSV